MLGFREGERGAVKRKRRLGVRKERRRKQKKSTN